MWGQIVPQTVAAFLGGMGVEAVMSDRTIDTSGGISRGGASGLPVARSVDTGRAPIERSGEGRAITDAPQSAQPAPDLAALNAAILQNAPRTIGVPWNPHIVQSADPELDTTNRSEAGQPLYGTDSPFAILADLGLRLFPNEQTTPQTTYVPVIGSSAGGGNVAMIVLLLAGLGAAYYFFVYRKRGGNVAS